MDNNTIGSTLAIAASVVSVIGVVANNLVLDHTLAMQIWAISNPVFMLWAVGYWRKWWDGGLSGAALVANYIIFTVTNIAGLVMI